MEKILFKEGTQVLAVKESDVRFSYTKSDRLKKIGLSTNKVIEMKENGLLTPEKIQQYSVIALIHAKKKLMIPIVKGSGRYGGKRGILLGFSVSPSFHLKRGEMHNWHLRSK